MLVWAWANLIAAAASAKPANCLRVVSVTFINFRPRDLSSACAGVSHSSSTVSVASCCAVWQGGNWVMKKRVSKILGMPTGVIQWAK